MSLSPAGKARVAGDGEIRYLRDSSHRHEGGHRIAVAGREVDVLPDDRTTAKNRNSVITRVLGATQGTTVDPVEALVGALVLSGATNITIDGESILDSFGEVVAAIRLEVLNGDRGPTIKVTSIGGEA